MNDNVVSLTKKLISYATVSKDSNLKLIYYIQDLFQSYQIETSLQYDLLKNKANLIATVGPQDIPGIVLSGHSDVVPVADQHWNSNPFDAVVRNDKLYGRGACDMKGFLASILACLPKIKHAKNLLQRPLHFIFTYDEEVGCHGAKNLVPILQEKFNITPWLCIVGEPSQMKLVSAHKGMYLLNTIIKGIPAHSSEPTTAISAIQIAARLICFLEDFLLENQKKTDNNKDCYQHLGTTMNIGKISGGSAINIVPELARLDWEIRFFSNSEANELLDTFKKYSLKLIKNATKNLDGRELEIITNLSSTLPSLNSYHTEELLKRMSPLIDDLNLNHVNYCTEAGIFQQTWKCPTVICGPGSILQAHKADEFVTLQQLTQSVQFIERIIEYCTVKG